MYSEPSGHEDSSGTTQYLSYLFKILSKSQLSDLFFGYFVSILSSEVEIAYQNSDIWKSKITWSAIDKDKNRFIAPFSMLTPTSPQHQQLRHIRHTLTHTSSYFVFLWYQCLRIWDRNSSVPSIQKSWLRTQWALIASSFADVRQSLCTFDVSF